jgi:HD-GYP domain-containing protein (c-di-GMP phosphodiesterase class II)
MELKPQTTAPWTATPAAEQARPLLTLLELRGRSDPTLLMHGESVGELVAMAAEQLDLPPVQIGRLRLAGILHDIGKITVSDRILNKPGRLTEGEWAEIRRHPETGYRLILSVGLEDIADWVLVHHERPDGRGYPYGLSAVEIPLEGSILAVADAYHAMVAERPYQGRLSHAEACWELQECAGSQFDGGVVDAVVGALEADERLLK